MSTLPASSVPESSSYETLCVDLDSTLIATDLLWESALALVKQNPRRVFALPLWALRGRAYLKAKLADSVRLDPALLPYREEMLETIQRYRECGCQTISLVTASDQRLAEDVAAHLGVFDEVIGSTSETNLKGQHKVRVIRERYGSFIYAGDSASDLHVWAQADAAIVVGSRRMYVRAQKVTTVEQLIETDKPTLKDYLKAMRPHHWCKNVLLFLPLLLSHRFDPALWWMTVLGFLFFGLCASSIYILNDLFDLTSDRRHPWKRKRPFASGKISIPSGFLLSFGLLTVSLTLGALLIHAAFAICLFGYWALSFAYSTWIKRKVLVDIFVLTSFYGIRVMVGAVISGIVLSHWFLAFSMFFFLSLAMAKRFSELIHAKELVAAGNSGRAYLLKDAEILSMSGIASAFASIVVFSLYVASPEVAKLYAHPAILMTMTPLLLYWQIQIWLQARRGLLNEDPVTLAMRDRSAYVVGGLAIAILIAATVTG